MLIKSVCFIFIIQFALLYRAEKFQLRKNIPCKSIVSEYEINSESIL